MIGIFDSGRGGFFALRELRMLLPNADICFLADRKNAPYGKKSEEELLRLVKEDIKLISDKGADIILMACCTASTVYKKLNRAERSLCCPIIRPTAREAIRTVPNGKIAVIATDRTVASRAFSNALKSFGAKDVLEISLGELVSDIEGGLSDECIDFEKEKKINNMLLPIKEWGADALILGCTHFAHVEKTIKELLKDVALINSARVGAYEIKKKTRGSGSGKTLFL